MINFQYFPEFIYRLRVNPNACNEQICDQKKQKKYRHLACKVFLSFDRYIEPSKTKETKGKSVKNDRHLNDVKCRNLSDRKQTIIL